MGTGGVKLATHLHLVPSLRIHGAIPPLAPYIFVAWYLVKHRDNFPIIHRRPGSGASWTYILGKLTPWSRVLLEKLIVTQRAKKFIAVYGTLRFIIVFTTASHWCLS
jgi:hypothetical protein